MPRHVKSGLRAVLGSSIRKGIMNNSLDVLFLVGDDTTHPQQIADLEHLGFQIHRYTELAELFTHVAQHAVSLIVLTGSLPKIHIAAAHLRAMSHTLGNVGTRRAAGTGIGVSSG